MELDMFHDYCEIMQRINKQNNGVFSLFEKIVLAIILLFLLAGIILISGIYSKQLLGVIFMITSIIALIAFCLFQSKKTNALVANNRHKTKENEKHQELRKLLKEYGFNYKEDTDMDNLMNLLSTKHEEYNLWGKALVSGKNIFTVTIIPILTYILTKIAEDANRNQILIGGVILIVIITAVLAFSWSIYQVCDELMNKTYYTYGKFFSDIKQVKTFKNRELK